MFLFVQILSFIFHNYSILYIELFPNNCNTSFLSELSTSNSHNETIQTKVLVPSDNSCESISKPTTFSSESHTSTSFDVSPQAQSLRCSNRVTQIPAHLHDYHYYSTTLSLYEPKTYKKVVFNLA